MKEAKDFKVPKRKRIINKKPSWLVDQFQSYLRNGGTSNMPNLEFRNFFCPNLKPSMQERYAPKTRITAKNFATVYRKLGIHQGRDKCKSF